MAFFEFVGWFTVESGRLPKFLGECEDFYTARDYPELRNLTSCRMFTLAGRDRPDLLPEFLVRRLFPDAEDFSGQVALRPVSFPPKSSKAWVVGFLRRSREQANQRKLDELLANLPDEL